MNKSKEYKNINTAIFAVQGEISGVSKNAQNKYYNSSYSSYDEIKKAIQPALTSNKLLVEHKPIVEYEEVEAVVIVKKDYQGEDKENTQLVNIPFVTCVTRITHVETDEWVEVGDGVKMPCTKFDMHGIQSAITYIKRQNMIIVFDIATTDDDGNGAVNSPDEQRQVRTQRRPKTVNRNNMGVVSEAGTTLRKESFVAQPARQIVQPPESNEFELRDDDLPFGPKEPALDNKPQPVDNQPMATRPLTDQERRKLGIIKKNEYDIIIAEIQRRGIPANKWLAWLRDVYGHNKASEITEDKYDGIMRTLKEHPETIINHKESAN